MMLAAKRPVLDPGPVATSAANLCQGSPPAFTTWIRPSCICGGADRIISSKGRNHTFAGAASIRSITGGDTALTMLIPIACLPEGFTTFA